MINVRAQLKTLRMSPKKVRLIVNLVRGMNAVRAEEKLTFLQKRAGEPILKLLRSAIANALKNNNLRKDSLRITEVTVNAGPVMRRSRPRAHGRAFPIKKRSSHVIMVLGGEPDTDVKPVKAKKEATAPIKSEEKSA